MTLISLLIRGGTSLKNKICVAGIDLAPYQRGNKNRGQKTKETYAAQKTDKKAALINAFDACNMDGSVTVDDMAEYLGISRRTVERRVKECAELTLENGDIQRTKSEK